MEDKNCLFCNIHEKGVEILYENNRFYSRYDKFPVNKGHVNIIIKKHIVSFFDLTKRDISDLLDAVKNTKTITDITYNPNAYNIGINDGEEAGRTIHHLHIHLIPRYKGDVENPKGGVRNIIPGKGDYTKLIDAKLE